LEHLKKAYKVDLSYCTNINDEGLENLVNAHIINLTYCENITNDGLKYLSNVRKINLTNCKKITDEGLVYLKNVHEINLSMCNLITNIGIINLKNVQIIILLFCNQITEDIYMHLKNVNTIVFSNQKFIVTSPYLELIQNILFTWYDKNLYSIKPIKESFLVVSKLSSCNSYETEKYIKYVNMDVKIDSLYGKISNGKKLYFKCNHIIKLNKFFNTSNIKTFNLDCDIEIYKCNI
jgi:hypothetical protein